MNIAPFYNCISKSRNTMRLHCIVLFLICSLPAWVEEPDVSNRSPEPKEVRYNPANGEGSKVNPPGFVWLPEDQAFTYTLQCSSTEDFSTVEYQAEDIPYNVHCPPKLLYPGTWYWRYRFTTDEGESSNWSVIRTFTIPKEAVHNPQPTTTDLLQRLPESHPKLFLRREMIDNKYVQIAFNFPEYWENFIDHAKQELEVPIVREEPPPYPSGGDLRTREKADIDVWRSNRRIVVPAVERAANLAFAYMLTGEEAFGNRAKEWVMAVTAWDPHGTTGYRMNDECAMPIMSRISRAYTWAYDMFTDEEREIVRNCMAERARDAYEHLIRTKHLSRPYGSHNNRAWHFLGEVAIAFIDDIPEAKKWLKYSMDVFFNVYPAWSDPDGGWHEGIAYWRSYITRVTWWLDIMETALEIDGFKNPYFKHAGDFAVYVNPPESEFAGFGDMADTHDWKRNQDLMKYLAGKTNNQFWQYYGTYQEKKQVPDHPTYLDLLRLNTNPPSSSNINRMPPSKIFQGTGIASLHSFLGMNNLDTHILFKSSPFGTQSHGFNAQNSFILWREGLPVLHWSGHRDWHGSGHHTGWMWETKSDNSITVNGEGQLKHHSDAKGKIVSHYLGDAVDYVAGDASEAYEERLDTFIRHVIFIKPDMVFLIDELKAPQPSTFEFHLHAGEEFMLENQYGIRATNQTSGVRIAIATPSNLDVTQTVDMEPKPVNWDKEYWHLTAATTEKRTEQQFITLMKTFGPREMAAMRTSFFDIENVDAYGFQINNDKALMLTVNSSKENYSMRDTVTDAHILVLYTNATTETVMSFAIDASYLEIGGRVLLESQERSNYMVPLETMKNIFMQYRQNPNQAK